jgi:hypothetical protein
MGPSHPDVPCLSSSPIDRDVSHRRDPRDGVAYTLRNAAACGEFETLKDKGLGYRDLGLPAARACLLKRDQDAAIAWLRSIPSRFLPAALEKDPGFTLLQNCADFRALFVPR